MKNKQNTKHNTTIHNTKHNTTTTHTHNRLVYEHFFLTHFVKPNKTKKNNKQHTTVSLRNESHTPHHYPPQKRNGSAYIYTIHLNRAHIHIQIVHTHIYNSSCHVTSRHVTSRIRHVTSHHITSRHVTSRHVTYTYGELAVSAAYTPKHIAAPSRNPPAATRASPRLL